MGRSSKLIVYLAAAVLLSGPASAASMGGARGGGAGLGGAGPGVVSVGVVRAGAGARAAAAPHAGSGRALTFGTRGAPAPAQMRREPGLGAARGAREHFRRADARGFPRFRRFGTRGRFAYPFTITDYGYGYGGDDGYGSDPSSAANGPALADAPNDGPDAGEPPYLPELPRPCVRPLIIKIGRGARRTTTTRVVYGGPPACVRGY